MDDALFPQYSAEGRDLIRKAYDVAEKALAGETRSNGTPFFGHPLAVAKIAAYEIGLPAECIAAVFLHEATRGGKVDLDIHSLKLDESVYTMVDGLNKISTIKPKDTRLEAENYKKLIIQYSTDPRVTVLKLADRLEVMRSLAIFPKADRERKVLETLMLYIPLAHQLGLYNMKREMEDIYLSYAEPEQYRLITNKLKATRKDREKLMAEFIEPLKVKLSEAGIQYKLKIRTKAAYSIWTKMVKQKVPFEGVFDVFAIRFIIDCPDDIRLERELCWKVFGFVTEEYEQDTKRLRDWVTTPKPNGYESLHITVKNRDGAYVEVQIRTRRMDEIAENGFASHWSYKGIKREETLDRWLTSVRYALEHPDTDNPEDLPQPPSREIFVFTPTGELRILPAGASVLDFAFSIHTNIGTRCVGGKVGGKPVPIKEKLHTGDVVEILTAKNQRPAPDWINFVVTTKARQKIKQALSEGEQKLASTGRELLERRLKNWKLEFPDEMLTEMMKKRKITSVNAFFAAVGEGTIDVNEIKEYILTEVMEPVIAEPRKELSKWAPKIIQMSIDPEKIGDVVGQRGKTINALIEKYDVSIDIEDNGFVSIAGTDNEKMKAAQEAISLIVSEFEKDMILTGKVISIKDFGAFLEFAPGKEGLVHISKIANSRIARVEDVLQLGDVVRVICLGKDKNGKFSFSIKDCPKASAPSHDVGRVVASADPE